MRFLTYPEIFELFEKEVISVDIDERAFDGLSASQIVDADHQIKDRMLEGNFLNWGNDIHTKKEIRLHASFASSVWRTVLGKFVVTRGDFHSIPLLERVSSRDPHIMGFLEISDNLHDRGFRLISGGLIDLNRRQLSAIEITNVSKGVGLVENDLPIANLRLVVLP